jgi:photosystem II stability/assembly factor-like uncharacterized protein
MTPRVATLVLLSALVCAFAADDSAAQGFNAVGTKDGVDVWAVGNGGAVYRSLNGGALWGSYPLGAAVHRGVAARGSRVWIVDDGGTLWTSTNNGISFSSQVLGDGSDLRGICFSDDVTGWIVGKNGVIHKTTDAGQTWIAKASSTSNHLYGVRVDALGAGWACGAAGTILSTTDSGESWGMTQPLPYDLYDVDVDGSTVYVGGTNGLLAKSTDGGQNWTSINTWLDSKSDFRGVDVTPGGALWLCGGGGFLRKSVDGAATFTYPQHSIVTGFSDVVFSDANKGWACATKSNNVARTTDGGATWTVPGGGAFTYSWSLKQSTAATIRGDSFDTDARNRNKLYAVLGKAVYASWNVGDTWTQIATIPGAGTRTNAFFVSHSDSNTWVAAVQDGDRVTRTTNGGATWTDPITVAFTEYGVPVEQDPNNPDVLYFGPEDLRLYKSTNFGANWTPISAPEFRSPCDLEVLAGNPDIIWVGDGVTGSGNGQMFRSTDGGATFTLIYTGSGSEIPMIGSSWLDPSVGYATHWSSGGVRRTTNFGASWPSVAGTSSAWGADVARDDPYCAMYGQYSGSTSFLTTNNGASFVTASLSGSNYGLYTYERGTYLALQSGGIFKASINQPGMPVDNSQSVAVLVPNGGEAWQYNDVRNITWSGQNLASVKIEYQNVAAGPWQLITASTPGAPGSYPWTVPNDPTAQAKVRVSDVADGAPIDESNLAFSILVPTIATDQSNLAYGQVPTGQAKLDTVRIVNSGTGTLVISSVTLRSGGPFVPSRTSFSIAGGASDTIAVTFTPNQIQAYEDTLDIASNAPQAVTIVPLSGEGVAATGVPGVDAAVPARFELRESLPNPFGRAGTSIAYSLPRECDVVLVVYNVQGQEVATLVRGRQPAGRYAVDFPSHASGGAAVSKGGLPSGVYFYRLSAEGFTDTKRMVMVR